MTGPVFVCDTSGGWEQDAAQLLAAEAARHGLRVLAAVPDPDAEQARLVVYGRDTFLGWVRITRTRRGRWKIRAGAGGWSTTATTDTPEGLPAELVVAGLARLLGTP